MICSARRGSSLCVCVCYCCCLLFCICVRVFWIFRYSDVLVSVRFDDYFFFCVVGASLSRMWFICKKKRRILPNKWMRERCPNTKSNMGFCRHRVVKNANLFSIVFWHSQDSGDFKSTSNAEKNFFLFLHRIRFIFIFWNVMQNKKSNIKWAHPPIPAIFAQICGCYAESVCLCI